MAIEGFLCHECIGDEYLKRQIKKRHKAQVCSGCAKRRKAISLEDLGIALDTVLRRNFVKTGGNEWEPGDELNYIVQEVLEAEPAIADLAIEAAMEQEDSYSVVKDGGELFYENAAEYVATPAHKGEYSSTWQMFCHNVKYTSRFFSDNAADRLQQIFRGLDRFRDRPGQKPVRLVSPSESELKIFRARLAETGVTAAPIIVFPASKLGPPPARAAVPGRMNPAGISVFYGGLDMETCVAEIRPPVGSFVVIGTFALLKPVHILDLTVLDKAYAELSYFQPDFEQITEQLAFLHSFHDEISSIVLPTDQALGFIPTQVVAEFLANHYEPKIDGILYASSQTAGRGLNIVLFHHASMVEGADVEEQAKEEALVASYWGGIDEDETLVISPETPAQAPETPAQAPETPVQAPAAWSSDVEFELSLNVPHSDIVGEPTLKVVPGSVRMLRVTGTQYTHEKVSVVDLRGYKRGSKTSEVDFS